MTDAERVEILLGLLANIHDALLDREDADVDGPNYAMRINQNIAETERRIGRSFVAVEVVAVPGVSA